MIINILQARYVRDYILDIDFDNWEKRYVDFSVFLDKGPMFLPLKDKEAFKDFYIDTTVMWKNGADVAPDTLYEIGLPVDTEDTLTSL